MSRPCTKCNKPDLTDSDFYSTRRVCKKCTIQKNSQRARTLIEAKRCVDCLSPTESGARCSGCKALHRERYHKNKEHHARTHKDRRQRLKLAVFSAYGGAQCACCKETHLEFLTIDHINGDGAEHRRTLATERGWTSGARGMTGQRFYFWLQQNNYPEGFRVLCLNCNFSLGHFGYCPHTR